ncbi:MAG: nicotinate-nucleotide--dimethylbenzimidazole phosphoribosyltransferase [Intestinibacillus sp.]
MNLQETILHIEPPDTPCMEGARRYFTRIAIPLGSLGLLEDAIVQLAGIQRTVKPSIGKRAVVVFCADNGVVAQGVTQCGQEVTAVVTENMDAGQSTVCLMAHHIGMDVFPVDIGVARDVRGDRIIRRKIAYGTRDMTLECAMTRDEAVRAIEVGIEMAEKCASEGYQLLCVGEMGIGNTTTSAAVTAVLTGSPATAVTGRGAGLSSAGLEKKIRAIQAALALHRPNPEDPIDVLHKVGGLDIAGMVGLYLGGAACGLPVVIDGVIAAAAALLACRLCPTARGYMLASHCPDEPAGKLLLEALEARTFLTAGMRLGEGTGAAAAVALLDLALAAYLGMPSFDDAGIEAYQPLT